MKPSSFIPTAAQISLGAQLLAANFSRQNKLRIAEQWLLSNSSFDDLRYAVSNFNQLRAKKDLIRFWDGFPNKTQADLLRSFDLLKRQNVRQAAKNAFSYRGSARVVTDVVGDDFDADEIDSETKITLVKSWINNSSRTSQDLEFALGLIAEEGKSEVIKDFLGYDQRSLAENFKYLPQVRDEQVRSEIAKKFVGTETSLNNKFISANLVEAAQILSFFADVHERSSIIKTYLEKKGENAFADMDLKDLAEKIFPQFDVETNYYLEQEFEVSVNRNLPDETTLSEKSKLVDDHLINGGLEIDLPKEMTIEELREFLSSSKASSKLTVITNFLESAADNLTIDKITEIISLAKEYFDEQSFDTFSETYYGILREWIGQPDRNPNELESLLPVVELEQDEMLRNSIRDNLIIRFLQKTENLSLEDFKKFFPLLTSDDDSKELALESLFKKHDVQKMSAADIIGLMPMIPKGQYQDRMIESFSMKDNITIDELRDFLPLVSSSFLREVVVKKFLGLKMFSNSQIADKISRSEDELRVVLPFVDQVVKDRIIKAFLKKDEVANDGNLLREFLPQISDISDSEKVLKFIINRKGSTLAAFEEVYECCSEKQRLYLAKNLVEEGRDNILQDFTADQFQKFFSSKEFFDDKNNYRRGSDSEYNLQNYYYAALIKWLASSTRKLEEAKLILSDELIGKEEKSTAAGAFILGVAQGIFIHPAIFQKARSFDDLRSIIGFVSDWKDSVKDDIVLSYFCSKRQSIDNLFEAMDWLGEYNKRNLLNYYVQYTPEITSEDLEFIMTKANEAAISIDSNHVLSIWLSKNDITFPNLQFALSLIDEKEKSQFLASLIDRKCQFHKDFTAENFEELIVPIGDKEILEKLLIQWLGSENRTSADLDYVLTQKSDAADSLIMAFFLKDRKIIPQRNWEEILSYLPRIESEIVRKKVQDEFLLGLKNSELSGDQLTINSIGVLYDLENKNEISFLYIPSRSSIAYEKAVEFIEQKDRTVEDLKQLIRLSHIKNKARDGLAYLLLFFIDMSNPQLKPNRNIQELKDVFETFEMFPDFDDSERDMFSGFFRDSMLKNLRDEDQLVEPQNKIILENLEDLTLWLHVLTQKHKGEICSSLYKKLKQPLDWQKLSTDLRQLNWTNKDIASVASYWFAMAEIEKSEIKNVLAEFKDDKDELLLAWHSRPDITREDSYYVLENLDDPNKRSDFAISLIRDGGKVEEFIKLLNSGVITANIYDPHKMIGLYYSCELDLKHFPSVLKSIYPNIPDLQYEAMMLMAKEASPESLANAKTEFLSFISEIDDSEIAEKFLAAITAKMKVSNHEILDIAQDRLRYQYGSIFELLEQHTVKDSLTEEGLKTFNETFPDVDSEKTSLSQLFSFYDLQQNGFVLFKSLIQPELLSKIRQDYKPAENKVRIKDFRGSHLASYQTEYDKLKSLLSDSGNEAEIQIPRVDIISAVLRQYEIPNYPRDKINDFVFGENDLMKNREEFELFKDGTEFKEDPEAEQNRKRDFYEKYRQRKSDEFKEILHCERANREKVAEFFKDIFEISEPINEISRDYLKEFINYDKFMLAGLLEKENGLTIFGSCIGALANGCHANIGSDARLAIAKTVITNPEHLLIFAVFCDEIMRPHNKEHGVEHFSAGADVSAIFCDPRVNNEFFSPNAFVKKAKEWFYLEKIEDGKKVVRKEMSPWSILTSEKNQAALGEGFTDALIEAEKADSIAADLAVFLIVKNNIPTLFENKFFADFRQNCEAKIAELQEVANSQKEQDEIDREELKNIQEEMARKMSAQAQNIKPRTTTDPLAAEVLLSTQEEKNNGQKNT